MTEPEYRAADAVNWSTAKLVLDKSPAHYRYALDNPGVEDSDTLAFGRLFHALLFEPSEVRARFVTWTGKVRNGGEWSAFQAEHAGRTIIKSAAEYARAARMASAARSNPALAPHLDGGQFELVIRWTDPATGLACKGRLDWLHEPTRTIIDPKTMADLSRRGVANAIARYRYHGQLAHYASGVEQVYGWRPERLALFGIEQAAPHDSGLFFLDADTIEAGKDDAARALATIAECRRTGVWPGRYPEPVEVRIPEYLLEDPESADGLGLTEASE